MRNGRYIRPSNEWITDFGNHDRAYFRHELRVEVTELVTSRNSGYTIYTYDSTPLEANRYSEWADYNVHYGINMVKEHIVMKDGKPLLFTIANDNKGDNPDLKKLLEGTNSYDSHKAYVNVYLKTGLVMSGNPGLDAVIHKEAPWENVVKRCSRLHRFNGFESISVTTLDFIIRFLAKHGEREIAGWFLQNLDIMRRKSIHAEYTRLRHLCETMHRARRGG